MIGRVACRSAPVQTYPAVTVSDDHDSGADLQVVVHWSGFVSGSYKMVWDGNYYGVIGPVPYPGKPNKGGVLKVWVTATDSAGNTGSLGGPDIEVLPCSGTRIL